MPLVGSGSLQQQQPFSPDQLAMINQLMGTQQQSQQPPTGAMTPPAGTDTDLPASLGLGGGSLAQPPGSQTQGLFGVPPPPTSGYYG